MAPRTSDQQHFWKLWSVQLTAIGGALAAGATAYGGVLLVSPKLVEGMPDWFGVALTSATVITNGLAMYTRTIIQSKLVEKSNAGEVPQNKEQSPKTG